MSSSKQRITNADLTEKNVPLSYLGNNYNLAVNGTCFGDFLVKAKHYAMLLTGAEEAAAYDHFRKVRERCPELKTSKCALKDHLEVLLYPL
jgi:hypothetical protein